MLFDCVRTCVRTYVCYMYILGDMKPKESDILRYIIPKFAAKWRDLGMLLEIPNYCLKTIAVNNTNHASYSEQCCKSMLQKWMEITPDFTWDKLQKCIGHLPGLSCNDNSESTYICTYVCIIM